MDVSHYLADAAALGLTIEYIIETHFHADFVSGHLELAAATGARIGYGAAAKGLTDFAIEELRDGRRIDLGDVWLEVLETPGHTPESICVVVYEQQTGEPHAVLTGDTLFIGDVGRPDLLSSFGRTQEEMARSLYSSLRNKLLTLPDATKVYPAHGAGSACGKNLSTETVST
ncbi:MAG: MBL fold metallo-hydrolase, partial [Actinobacteria bacterium]|nr:MBL fold metallo-hydrolase [Actinomycetota bacterium]